jgi:hypothetical protein
MVGTPEFGRLLDRETGVAPDTTVHNTHRRCPAVDRPHRVRGRIRACRRRAHGVRSGNGPLDPPAATPTAEPIEKTAPDAQKAIRRMANAPDGLVDALPDAGRPPRHNLRVRARIRPRPRSGTRTTSPAPARIRAARIATCSSELVTGLSRKLEP